MESLNGLNTEELEQNLSHYTAEKMLFRRRQHWFTLFLPILVTILLSALSISAVTVIAASVVPSQTIPLTMISLIILAATTTVTAKLIIDWYFHFYVLTDHRILEISYKPLFSDKINNVILNQVKSTEIDINTVGIINKLLDIGNVIITFDRPTHEEEFIFSNIKNPKSVGFLLCNALDVSRSNINIKEPAIVWFRSKKKKDGDDNFKFIEEIFPAGSFGAT